MVFMYSIGNRGRVGYGGKFHYHQQDSKILHPVVYVQYIVYHLYNWSSEIKFTIFGCVCQLLLQVHSLLYCNYDVVMILLVVICCH